MKHREKTLILTSSAAIGALLLTGCGSNDEPAAEDPAQPTAAVQENETAEEATEEPGTGSASATAETPSESASGEAVNGGQAASLAAIKTALAQYEGGDVMEVDYSELMDEFEVEVIHNDSEHEVVVDGTGENVTQDRQSDTADQDDLAELERATITAEEAVNRGFDEASAQEGTAKLDDVALDEDDGTLNWEVELDRDGADVTYYVDAETGSVSNRE